MPNPPVQARVLLIDDQPINETLMNAMLDDQADIVTRYLQDPLQACAVAEEFAPTVILLDLRMPTIDGLDVIRALKASAQLGDVPIIMLSSNDSPHAKADGFASGAIDYLVKWPDRIELAARVRAHSRAFHTLRERDQARRALEQSQAALLERTRELGLAQASLHEAEKMEAIGQLTGGVAHDFNNVLQLINGHLQLLRVAQRADEKVMRRLDAASEGVRRGAELAARLLAFARRQPLQPVTVRADLLVHGMAPALRQVLDGRACAIRAEGDALVALDQVEFEKTMLHLVRNAAEAMGPDGQLAIEIKPHSSAHGAEVCIELTDDGAGMSEEAQRRAFEPFFSTRPGRRAGIGLSLAFAFVKQSSGHIELANAPAGGTRVSMRFPAAPADQRSPTVLVVEDETAVRHATVEVLRKQGWCVLEAADGETALDLLVRRLPIDLLFTDVLLAGSVNGPALAAAVAQHLPHTRVLFASGFPGNDWNEGAPLLRKPYRLDEMSRMVRSLLVDTP